MPRPYGNPLPWLFAFLALIGACALRPGETVAPRTFFLSPDLSWNNPRPSNGRNARAVLLITLPSAQPGFETQRMAYLLRPYEIQYYGYNQWADTPARMLHRVMVKGFDQSGLWAAVLETPGTVRADYRLASEDLVVEQQFFSNPSRIRLSLRARLIDLKAQKIIAARHFEIFETALSDDPYGGVIAANHAAGKLLTEIAEWLDNIARRSTKTVNE